MGDLVLSEETPDLQISWISMDLQVDNQFLLLNIQWLQAVTLIISVIVISISMVAFKKLHAFDMEDV